MNVKMQFKGVLECLDPWGDQKRSVSFNIHDKAKQEVNCLSKIV